MAVKGEPVNYYSPIPPQVNPNPLHYYHQPPNQEDQYYILVPLHPHRRFFNSLRRYSLFFLSLILISTIIFFLWPSDPDLEIVRLKVNHVQILTTPSIALNISIGSTLKVFNRDLYSLDYKSLVVSIGYRGSKLGFVTSNEGHLKPRSSSYIDANLQIDGIEILHDVFYLLEDLARGSIPFDTVSKIEGKLGLFFFEVPIKAKVSCEVFVNTENQTVVRQNCYPE